MQTYISLLRGINVGAQKIIRMADLTRMYEALGAKNVETYVQSGNVVFDAVEASAVEWQGQLRAQILETFGFDVIVFVRAEPDLARILKQNPFLNKEPEFLHVTFLMDKPAPEKSVMLAPANGADEFAIGLEEIFLYCPGGYGKTKLSNAFFEKKLNVPATTRNWKTVKKLHEIAAGRGAR
jgi:uncharacterized protein (DUF1697 family)